MATSTFSGPIVSKNGFINTGPGNVVDADASISLTVASHSGKIIHNDAAGAVTYTLPALNATADGASSGPGSDIDTLNNIGATFTIVDSITKTGSLIVKVANANDIMNGSAIIVDSDTNDNTEGFVTTATSDTITLNGSTKGGVLHATITCTAISSTKWSVSITSAGTGNIATPFSAAVS
jgi:hypothetical protein